MEEKHGFNKQEVSGFIKDQIKSLFLSIIMGGILLYMILSVMEVGSYWWLGAWVLMNLFSLVSAWLYPTLLAPLFNKFTPVKEGELKKGIDALSSKINFATSGVFIMDASTRSSHGNAYFTGVFKKKRIVLFDTLVKDLNYKEVIAVLAHELGHFKLNHVRWSLIRGMMMSGLMFYLMSLCLPMQEYYTSFHFNGISNYAALLIFSMWFSLFGFLLGPLGSFISRKNEFAADNFAATTLGNSEDLISALKKLSESNRSMPLTHPLYSLVYHSHPPLLERLEALRKVSN